METVAYTTLCRAIDEQRHVFISGVGGCGKSYLLKQLHKKYNQLYPDSCLLASTTGISAYNLGGCTIHNWSKVVLPSSIPDVHKWIERKIKQIRSNYVLLKRYRKIRIIFLDEVSLLGANYMDALNYICQHVRQSNEPFGGIQLVLGGDFLQLQPIKDDFCFNSESWLQLNLLYVRLTKAYRFDHQDWVDLLQRARVGELNTKDVEMLQSRCNVQPASDALPPIYLASKNDVVDNINRSKLQQNNHETVIFVAQDYELIIDEQACQQYKIPMEYKDEISNQFIVDKVVYLKVGCEVMLLANIDVENGLANGSRGIVCNIDQEQNVHVMFDGNNLVTIQPMQFMIDDVEHIYCRFAIPLRLAYATSIHKSQSLTLAQVQIDIGKDVFCEGQSYVALSRCKSLHGLYITSLSIDKIKPNFQALRFEKKFLQQCIDV